MPKDSVDCTKEQVERFVKIYEKDFIRQSWFVQAIVNSPAKAFKSEISVRKAIGKFEKTGHISTELFEICAKVLGRGSGVDLLKEIGVPAAVLADEKENKAKIQAGLNKWVGVLLADSPNNATDREMGGTKALHSPLRQDFLTLLLGQDSEGSGSGTIPALWQPLLAIRRRVAPAAEKKDETKEESTARSLDNYKVEDQALEPQLVSAIEHDCPKAVLLGDPGSGKSECLRDIVRRRARDARAKLVHQDADVGAIDLALFIPLPSLADAISQISQWFESLPFQLEPRVLNDRDRCAAGVLRVLVEEQNLPDILISHFWNRLRSDAPLTLCFDAWDEVPDSGREALRAPLQAFIASSANAVWLSSRPSGFDEVLLQDIPQPVTV